MKALIIIELCLFILLTSCHYERGWYDWSDADFFKAEDLTIDFAGDWLLDSMKIERIGERTKGWEPGWRHTSTDETGRSFNEQGGGWIFYQRESLKLDSIIRDSCFFYSNNDGRYFRAYEEEILEGMTLDSIPYERRDGHLRTYLICSSTDSTFTLSQILRTDSDDNPTKTSYW